MPGSRIQTAACAAMPGGRRAGEGMPSGKHKSSSLRCSPRMPQLCAGFHRTGHTQPLFLLPTKTPSSGCGAAKPTHTKGKSSVLLPCLPEPTGLHSLPEQARRVLQAGLS